MAVIRTSYSVPTKAQNAFMDVTARLSGLWLLPRWAGYWYEV
jgi:hypothetical protein